MFFASLLFGISASLDALLVGISYGIRGIRIRPWQNLLISLVTLLGTCLSVGLGHRLVTFLPELIGRYAGSLVLILLGLYYIFKWIAPFLPSNQHSGTVPEYGRRPAHKHKTDKTGLTNITAVSVNNGKYTGQNESENSAASIPYLRLPEVLTLSLTLSLNNLSAGLSASLAGLTLIPAAVSTLACSVLFLYAGNRLGRNPVLQFTGRAAEPLSGALLIALGMLQFLL